MQKTMPSETSHQTGGIMWSTAVMLGIIQIILGFFLMIAPGMSTILLMQFLGLYWLTLGIISIVQIFSSRGNVHWGWLLFSGIIGIIAGFLVLRHPVWGGAVTVGFLTYLIIFYGFLRGIISIVQGLGGDGAWNLVLGIALVIISIYLLFNPFGAFIALPIAIGFFSFIGGLLLIYFGASIKNRMYVAGA
jgi:uncharacterized membrane protein HdeD (DUF308 family)